MPGPGGDLEAEVGITSGSSQDAGRPRATPDLCSCSTDELLSSLESYEIAFPTRVDHTGAPLAFSPPTPRRQRRGAGVAAESRLFYKVAAPSTHFLLNLTRSPRLLAGHVSVEYWTREGLAWQRAARAHCLYAGHLQGRAGSSRVAVSTCGGLVSRGGWGAGRAGARESISECRSGKGPELGQGTDQAFWGAADAVLRGEV